MNESQAQFDQRQLIAWENLRDEWIQGIVDCARYGADSVIFRTNLDGYVRALGWIELFENKVKRHLADANTMFDLLSLDDSALENGQMPTVLTDPM